MDIDSKLEAQDRIAELFPELGELEDEATRDKVVAVWLAVWRRSGLSDLADVPTAADKRGAKFKLVDHVRAVTQNCINMIAVMERAYPTLQIRRDDLVAAALLHDTDKVLSYAGDALASQTPHGYLGAREAEAAGLPPLVVHLIVTHPYKAQMTSRTVEGVILKYSDYAVSNVAKVLVDERLTLEKSIEL